MANHHLISINDIDNDEVNYIMQLANKFKSYPLTSDLSNKYVCCMFFEESTRTKAAFEISAKNLGAKVIDFDTSKSSILKGETLLDTISTLKSAGVSFFVIRHNKSGIFHQIRNKSEGIIINAGDGCNEHPSQALLDFFTIKEAFGEISGLTIAICGDIIHSRVARSNAKLLIRFGAKVKFVGPISFLPKADIDNIEVYDDLLEGIKDADVVMCFRLQKERMTSQFIPSESDYSKLYKITYDSLEFASPDVKLLHPGPINRDVEICSKLADDPKYSLIRNQVTNGVFVRQSIFNLLNEKTG